MRASLALVLFFSNAAVLTPPQRGAVAKVEKQLLAPCCYTQAVGEHASAEAAEMRKEIEQMAASGQSEAAIIAHYKAQYGERILVVPDGRTGEILFILPWVVLIVCLPMLVAVIWRMARAGERACSRAKQEEIDRWRRGYGEAVARELRDWT